MSKVRDDLPNALRRLRASLTKAGYQKPCKASELISAAILHPLHERFDVGINGPVLNHIHNHLNRRLP